jgi:HemY protein
VHAARDPAWTADGFVSDRWMPISPVSGRLDAFEWKTPLAEIGPVAEAEAEPEAHPVIEAQPAPPPPPPAPPETAPPPRVSAAASIERPAPAARRAPPPEAVIPLAHVPDDPGPEPDRERDAL